MSYQFRLYTLMADNQKKVFRSGIKKGDNIFWLSTIDMYFINVFRTFTIIIFLLFLGERPFACEECGRRFAEIGALRRHQRSRYDFFVLTHWGGIASNLMLIHGIICWVSVFSQPSLTYTANNMIFKVFVWL